MFVAAMIDALPALEPLVQAELAKVRPDGGALPAIHADDQRRHCARAGSSSTLHAHGDARACTARRIDASRAHRRCAARREDARSRARDPRMARQAEANVHGTPIEDVHFHELADWDSMLDVVAAGCIAGALDGARWSASALPLGGGTIRAEHGVLPVPAPATAWLATGYRMARRRRRGRARHADRRGDPSSSGRAIALRRPARRRTSRHRGSRRRNACARRRAEHRSRMDRRACGGRCRPVSVRANSTSTT